MKQSDMIFYGAVGMGLWWIWSKRPQVPSVTEAATNAYWDSSLGDLTNVAADWYTNGWGDGWDYQYESTGAADRLQERFEGGSYGSL